MEQAPVQIGQFILGKNLGIGAFGKVSEMTILCAATVKDIKKILEKVFSS
jgi:hypothetical protein